ncbi:hypothetical protein VB780_13550 [Leptolyngbya sp. CCNP1308]|uniref:hypothetical protein n=1 Tax=Leptolyngbya sp. CCNP1308 TaxID=3110255 RepID=UPI002B200BB6|nr:hypothetical protein [Leptolyngbya sp. CCNP1308]MEA5449604.1 hypothetical protein [Leptolyngbya sp. CCNP1308]
MKAYEFAGKVMADGQLKLPESALAQLAGLHAVRVIVLMQNISEIVRVVLALVGHKFLPSLGFQASVLQ